jgi:LacI family transcriptional regulator
MRPFKVFLLIESSRASGRHLLEGIVRYTHHHGPWSFYWEPRGLAAGRATLKKLDVDGVIFRDVELFKQEVLRRRIPAVVVGHSDREIRGLINVVTESDAVGRMAADHLLHCGFKQFAFCGLLGPGDKQVPWSEDRFKAFRERVVRAGFGRPPAYLLAQPGADWPAQRRRLADWISKLPTPAGVMACNDDCGVQVAEACKVAGRRVPDEVGIVGVDNDEVVCGLCDPPMTSVEINFERAGYETAQALELLMRKSRRVPGNIMALASRVVPRRSTDFVAVDDPCLARALIFMRDHAGSPFSVAEVAQAASASRRSLERRFRKRMGVSVLHEIRRVRTDEMARLLLETSLPVSQIAEKLGFEDDQHFARYFRAARKLRPLAFRKAYGKLVNGA